MESVATNCHAADPRRTDLPLPRRLFGGLILNFPTRTKPSSCARARVCVCMCVWFDHKISGVDAFVVASADNSTTKNRARTTYRTAEPSTRYRNMSRRGSGSSSIGKYSASRPAGHSCLACAGPKCQHWNPLVQSYYARSASNPSLHKVDCLDHYSVRVTMTKLP
ncbi:hypothetical protein LZ31DRAFT_13915 [Colletotrichum somersetense]|nr:hypothetical protein LZ31DRAFT_13915 [Colletotrichum somersetense]